MTPPLLDPALHVDPSIASLPQQPDVNLAIDGQAVADTQMTLMPLGQPRGSPNDGRSATSAPTAIPTVLPDCFTVEGSPARSDIALQR